VIHIIVIIIIKFDEGRHLEKKITRTLAVHLYRQMHYVNLKDKFILPKQLAFKFPIF
jgi:hypothetical protein